MGKSILNLILGLTVIVLNTGCFNFFGECETEYDVLACDPSNELKIICLTTDCGATTTPSYVYRIAIGCCDFNYGNKEDTFLGSDHRVDVYWASSDTIVVSGAKTSQWNTHEVEVILDELNKKVFIEYR